MSNAMYHLLLLFVIYRSIFMGITAKDIIGKLNATKIITNRDILYCTFVAIGSIGNIPRTLHLLPRSLLTCSEVNIHVCTI